VNWHNVAGLVSLQFDGFTILKGIGYWHGQQEQCLVIEIVTDDNEGVRLLAKKIKDMNSQDVVMVQGISIGSWLE